MTRSGCGKKTKYPTAKAAGFAMWRARSSGRVLGLCNVYRCTVCGGWHWGRIRGTQGARGQQVVNAIDRALSRDQEKRRDAPKEDQ